MENCLFYALGSVYRNQIASLPASNRLSDGRKRRGLQKQPVVVSAALPGPTAWLQLRPGESALVTPKKQAMTHL